MAPRVICINPCPPSNTTFRVNVPFAGAMNASPALSLRGSCTDCEAIASLMNQIQPLFAALGIPLCLIKCSASIVGLATALGDLVTDLPAPNITAILEAIQKVVENCGCVLQLVDPTGVCAFVRMIRDFLLMAIGTIGCVNSLFSHLLILHLKSAVTRSEAALEKDPIISAKMIETAVCLEAYTSITQQTLLVKFTGIKIIFELLGAVFTFVEALMGPLPVGFDDIKSAFVAFEDTASGAGVVPSDVIEFLDNLKNLLQGAYDLLAIPGCTT